MRIFKQKLREYAIAEYYYCYNHQLYYNLGIIIYIYKINFLISDYYNKEALLYDFIGHITVLSQKFLKMV